MTATLNDMLVGPVVPAASATLISIDFYFEDETYLEVYKSGSETPLTLGVDYTVSECSAEDVADGSITLTVAANGTDSYAIYGKQPLERSSDLQFRGDLRSPVLNRELNRIWRAMQALNTALDRAFRFSKTTDLPDPLDLGTDASRVGKVIGFTADGSGLALVASADGITLPGSSVDNSLIRWSGTGANTIDGSLAFVTDAGVLQLTNGTDAGSFSLALASAAAVIDVDPGNVDASSHLLVKIDGSAVGRWSSAGLRVGDGTTPGDNLEVIGTGSIRVPVGTTAQRPSGTQVGRLRYNSTTSKFEIYGAAGWADLTFDPAAVGADLLPSTDSTYDLGSATFAWALAHVDEVRAATISGASGNSFDPATLTGQWAARATTSYTISGGTPNLDEGRNVSSLTDQGVGRIKSNFTNNFNNNAYAAAAICERSSGSSFISGCFNEDNDRSTSAYEVGTGNSSDMTADLNATATFTGVLA